MKKFILFFSFLLISKVYAQNKSLKQFDITVSEIEIATEGLDEIIIENSKDNKITVFLDDENSFSHSISNTEEEGLLKINFKPKAPIEDGVFRKFITERVNRARVTIKIPKHKKVTFLGGEIDIVSKNYLGNISIFIDKGEIKLGKVFGNVDVKLYSGNISATLKNHSFDIKTTNGKILVDKVAHQNSYKKLSQKSTKIFIVKSIKANVVLKTKKTQ